MISLWEMGLIPSCFIKTIKGRMSLLAGLSSGSRGQRGGNYVDGL